MVISSEYRRSFIVNIALITTLCRARHLVLGMNLSARSITSNRAWLKNLIDRIFARSTLVVVHSIREAHLFAVLHQMPEERFVFSHWGYDLPESESSRFSNSEKPYFCLIGRNNRDVETFCKAVNLAGVRGLAILPGYIQLQTEIEQTLEIYRDLPLADCIDCIRHAAANVTLLRDDDRGAGHITVVTALHLGVPQIHSDVAVLREYLPDSRFSTPVPIGDAEAVAEAMRTVLQTEQVELVDLRRSFAREWLSHERATERTAEIVVALLNDRALPLVSPDWRRWLSCERQNKKGLDGTT